MTAVRTLVLLASLSLSFTLAACGGGSKGCSQGAAACRDGGIDAAREAGRGDRGVVTSMDGSSDRRSAVDTGTPDRGRDAPAERRDARVQDATTTDGHKDAPVTDGHKDAPIADGRAREGGQLSDGGANRTDARPKADGGAVDAGMRSETSKCAVGSVRVHVRDIWSPGVTPTLGLLTGPPAGVLVTENQAFNTYAARLDSAVDVAGGACAYYSACIPNTTTGVTVGPMLPTGCEHVSRSAGIDISALNRSGELWIEYTGTSATLPADYAQSPKVPVGPGKFNVTADSSKLVAPACKIGTPAPETAIANTVRVHFRWPWTDPLKTGYPGAACGDDGLGYSPPPYPTSLAVTGLSCSLQALLEFQDSHCTWYSALIPKSALLTNADSTFWFEYPVYLVGLRTDTITLPTFSHPASEYWIAFDGIPGVSDASTAAICGSLQGSNVYTVSTQNPGPGYPGCGGG